MLTITPEPAATIGRAAACAMTKAALTLSAIMRSKIASSTSRNGCGRFIPALLTRMSRRGRPAIAARALALSITSNGSDRARPPVAAISPASASSSAGVRLLRMSSAPAAASASATARPIPRPAPVTSATLPSSRNAFCCEGAFMSRPALTRSGLCYRTRRGAGNGFTRRLLAVVLHRVPDRLIVVGRVEFRAVAAPGALLDDPVDLAQFVRRYPQRDDLPDPHHDVPRHHLDTLRRKLVVPTGLFQV